MNHILAHFTVLAALIISLDSCSPTYDPDYRKFEAGVQKNPDPMAIVGMWYREGDPSSGNPRSSLLFTSEGKFYARSSVAFGVASNPNANSDALGNPLEYKYRGNGVWSDARMDHYKYRISGNGNHLLTTTSTNLYNYVYKRQE